ncbi:MAG: nucleotidyl transferase AbiEii/AbiGii toxin family protein [Planctomycetes bacterium]|nr:nucleotidyl transferase AbiEii/AbiGii toxin family protein [Planctomycetota bacterium]
MIEQRYADLFAQGARVPLAIAEREVVLTYVLKILQDAGILKTLAFKGGTCLRKCIYGGQTRFSVDLDFTSVGEAKADDLILELVDALGRPAYGLEFRIDAKDFFASEDGFSCGAIVGYRHAWNQNRFKLEVSLRERPSLPLVSMPLVKQSYFKHLEFKPFALDCFAFEELLAEKIRASYQRVRSRDLYDLAKAAQKPLNAKRIRTLAVIKCWNVRESFNPAKFLDRLRSSKYDWDDLRQLVRRGEKIVPEKLSALCEQRFKFLLALTDNEKKLAEDAHRHRLDFLPRALLEEADE